MAVSVNRVMYLSFLNNKMASLLSGEDLAVTAMREVVEETGIEAEFVSVLGFRHQHNFRFGCSDWYFICLMKALTTEIKHCPQEIAECKWISVSEDRV